MSLWWMAVNCLASCFFSAEADTGWVASSNTMSDISTAICWQICPKSVISVQWYSAMSYEKDLAWELDPQGCHRTAYTSQHLIQCRACAGGGLWVQGFHFPIALLSGSIFVWAALCMPCKCTAVVQPENKLCFHDYICWRKPLNYLKSDREKNGYIFRPPCI